MKQFYARPRGSPLWVRAMVFKEKRVKKAIKYSVPVLLILGLPLWASAAIVTYELSVEFSGGTPPQGPAPWLKATFADTGANQVTLTMDSGVAFGGLTGGEFVSEWSFNVQDDYVGGLSFARTDSTDVIVTSVSQKLDAFKADGDGYFDILFGFSTANNDPGRFGAGESIIHMITGGSGLDASDFVSRSLGAGNSPNGLYTAAHVQGIGYGTGSGWITTAPLPATVWLLGSALLGLAAIRGRMKK